MKKYINKIKRNLPVINLLLIIILFYLFDYKNLDSIISSSSDESNIIEVMGVIKPNAETGEWEILDDNGHLPIGISNIEVFSDHIEIFYEHTFEKVITVAVTPDESLTLEGINSGASVDLDKMKIFIAKDGQLVKPQDIRTNDKNIWIYVKGKLKNE